MLSGLHIQIDDTRRVQYVGKRMPGVLVVTAIGLLCCSCAHVEALPEHQMRAHRAKYLQRARLYGRAAVRLSELPSTADRHVVSTDPSVGGMHGALVIFPVIIRKWGCCYAWQFNDNPKTKRENPIMWMGRGDALSIWMNKNGTLQNAYVCTWKDGKCTERKLSRWRVKRAARAIEAGKSPPRP
jgi:hypothetical protein